MELGLSVHETDASGLTPLYYLCRAQDDLGKALDIYRYLSSQGSLDEVVQDVFLPEYRERRKSSLYRFIWRNSELLDFIVTEFHPNFYRMPAKDRFRSISWIYADPRVVLDILLHSSSVSASTFLAQLHGNVQSSLHEFAKIYFQRCLDRLYINGVVVKNDTDLNHWRELLRWMCRGITLEEICRQRHGIWECETPLLSAMLHCKPALPGMSSEPQCASHRLTEAIHAWLEDLFLAGVDLNNYGKREWDLYEQDVWLQTWCWNNLVNDCGDSALGAIGPSLTTFSYGPRPNDWVFKWESGPCEIAVDSQEAVTLQSDESMCMPGAWVRD